MLKEIEVKVLIFFFFNNISILIHAQKCDFGIKGWSSVIVQLPRMCKALELIPNNIQRNGMYSITLLNNLYNYKINGSSDNKSVFFETEK